MVLLMKSKNYKKLSSNGLSENKSNKNKCLACNLLKHKKSKKYINKEYSLITLNLYNTTLNLSSLFNLNSDQKQSIPIILTMINLYPYDILERLNILVEILSLFLSKIYLYFHCQACLALYFWQTISNW